MHQYCILNIFDVYFLEKIFPWFTLFASFSMGPPEVLEDAFLCNKDVRYLGEIGILIFASHNKSSSAVRLCTDSIFHSTPRTYFVAQP